MLGQKLIQQQRAVEQYSRALVAANDKLMIIARLVERIDIGHDYEIEIKFRISVEQYMRSRRKRRAHTPTGRRALWEFFCFPTLWYAIIQPLSHTDSSPSFTSKNKVPVT